MDYEISSREFYFDEFAEESFHKPNSVGEEKKFDFDPEDNIPF